MECSSDHKFIKCNNQGVQLRIEWKGDSKPTWEPSMELGNVEAYDIYVAHNDISKASNKRKPGRPRKYIMDGECCFLGLIHYFTN